MLNNKMNNFVYMVINNNKGFTFISVMFTLFIILITLPFVGYLLKNSSNTEQFEDISVQQFFIFIRNEIIYAKDTYVEDNKLVLKTKDEEIAKMEQYKNTIRRQMKGRHEIYLRDVHEFILEPMTYGVKVTVTTESGGTYEKRFAFYKKCKRFLFTIFLSCFYHFSFII